MPINSMKSEKKYSIGAFFDVDKTLVNYNTMFGFYWYYHMNRRIKLNFPPFNLFERSGNMIKAFVKFASLFATPPKNGDLSTFNRKYYYNLKGVDKEEYHALANQWFLSKKIISTVNSRVMQRLKEHQAQEHVVVLVSGSHTPLIHPIGKELNINFVIATELETSGKYFTGKIRNDMPLVGEGKAKVIKKFAGEYGIDLSKSYAYSDHISDIKMLKTVGNPYAVIGDKRLMLYAKKNKWNMIIL